MYFSALICSYGIEKVKIGIGKTNMQSKEENQLGKDSDIFTPPIKKNTIILILAIHLRLSLSLQMT